MLDLRYLRNSPNEAEDRLRSRDPKVSLERLKALDAAGHDAGMVDHLLGMVKRNAFKRHAPAVPPKFR